MKKRIGQILLFCLTLICPVLITVSCTDVADELQQQSADSQKVQMTLRVRSIDRATSASGFLRNERMHSLRIIVLEESGAIERNIFIGFPDAPKEQYEKVLEFEKRGHKTFYLIANESSIDGLHGQLNKQKEGTKDFEQFINNLSFVPDYSKPLPMTSSYTVNVGEERYIEKTFYVVYAATKFDIDFVNNRDLDVTVKSFTLSSPASSMYLMPHLDEDAGVYKANSAGRGEKVPFVFDNEERYWIDWLKDVAEESRMYRDDKTLADRRGWIMEYAIPEGAQQTEPKDILQLACGEEPFVLAKNQTTDMPTFYLPESRNLAASSAFAAGLEQEYMLNIVLTETDEGGIREQIFSDIRLPNLRALFRNTHVIVDINIKSNILEVVVDLVPYTSKELKPVFGLDV